MSTPEQRLEALGLTLPTPPQPAGSYTRAVAADNLVFVSGQLPMADGKICYAGALGKDLSVEQGQEAARLCALNALSVLRAECGGWFVHYQHAQIFMMHRTRDGNCLPLSPGQRLRRHIHIFKFDTESFAQRLYRLAFHAFVVEQPEPEYRASQL